MAEGMSFDVLMKFIVDSVGAERDAGKTADAFADLDQKVKASSKNLEAQIKTLKALKAAFKESQAAVKDLDKQYKAYETFSKEAKARKAQQDPAYKSYVDLKAAIAKTTDEIELQTKAVEASKEANKKLKAEIAAVTKEENARQAALTKTSVLMTRVASVVGRISTSLIAGGTLVSGGLFNLAKDFIGSIEEETRLTREWKAETDKVAESYKRIGQVAASELLPFLSEAANIADKIAAFAENNPDVIGAAFKVGLITLAVGLLGKALAGGIKLVADAAYIAASATQLLASAQNLLAAVGMQTASGIFATTVGVVLIPALVILAGILSGILVGLMAYQGIAKATGLPDLEQLGGQSLAIIKAKSKELWDSITGGISRASDAAEKFGENTEKLVEAFTRMKDDLLAEDEKFNADRAKIARSSLAEVNQVNRATATKIKSINDRAAASRDRIISDFAAGSLQAEEKYEFDRARIIRDGGEAIVRIEQERLEKLRQLEQDHSDRVDELTANRDALGLVLEQRSFDRDKAELDRGTNAEIQQRRADLVVRLQDQAANFAAERAQKLANYLQDLKENEARREADIKEEQKRAQEALRRIRENAAARLRELDLQHREEQKRIRDAFIAKVRDLDASLLGEQTKKRQAYSLMLSDLDKFLADYRAKAGGIAGSARAGSRAGGGYVYNELIQTHGVEFVTSQATTRALEGLIGARLNQGNLVAAVASGGGTTTWNDNRRFSGEYTKSMRRQIRQDTLDTLGRVVRGKK